MGRCLLDAVIYKFFRFSFVPTHYSANTCGVFHFLKIALLPMYVLIVETLGCLLLCGPNLDPSMFFLMLCYDLKYCRRFGLYFLNKD